MTQIVNRNLVMMLATILYFLLLLSRDHAVSPHVIIRDPSATIRTGRDRVWRISASSAQLVSADYLEVHG